MKWIKERRKRILNEKIQAFYEENKIQIKFIHETEGKVGLYYAEHTIGNWWDYLTGGCLQKPGTIKLVRGEVLNQLKEDGEL
jgi:nuclear transport factor 2 (NTF2) superfamily protein